MHIARKVRWFSQGQVATVIRLQKRIANNLRCPQTPVGRSVDALPAVVYKVCVAGKTVDSTICSGRSGTVGRFD